MDECRILSEVISEITDPSFLSDDAFVLGDFVITKDLLVEDVHFFPDAEPQKLAKKALRVNLSDLAAMGSEPVGYFLGLVLGKKHKDPEWLKNFATGLLSDQKHYSVKLFGGDTTIHSGPLIISITMIGKKSDQVLTRSGARAGDTLCVSGPIGDSYLGLLSYKGELGHFSPGNAGDKVCVSASTGHLYRGAADVHSYFQNKYDLPDPQLRVSMDILPFATSCIDISDGLLNEAQHIAKSSDVVITILMDDVPISHYAEDILHDNPAMRKELLTAGDDYQLLFTVPRGCHIAEKYPVIGFVSEGKSCIRVLDSLNDEVHFNTLGFVHK